MGGALRLVSDTAVSSCSNLLENLLEATSTKSNNKENQMKYYVSAPAFGTIASNLTRSNAYRIARKWEKDNGWGRGTASVNKQEN